MRPGIGTMVPRELIADTMAHTTGEPGCQVLDCPRVATANDDSRQMVVPAA